MALEDYITIPELPEATSLQNADLLPIRDSLNGIDKKLTYANLQAQIVALFRDFASIYDNTKSYKLNAVIEDITTGILYKSLVDNNNFALTDTTKWEKLGDLSLINDLLTTFNIANKLLKLNSSGLIDNTLLKNQYIYSEGITGNASSWSETIYNANGTINKIIQGGFCNTPMTGDGSRATITFPTAFPTQCLFINGIIKQASNGYPDVWIQEYSKSSTSAIMTYQCWSNNATFWQDTTGFFWQAIGN